MTSKAETLKLVTSRGTRGLLISPVVVAAIGTALVIAGTSELEVIQRLAIAQPFMIVRLFFGLLVLVMGIRLVTDEYRNGTIAATLTATPDRRRVLVTKTVAASAFGALLGFLAFWAMLGVGYAWLAIDGTGAVVPFGEGFGLAWSMVVAGIGWAVLGVAIGAIVRHQLAAVVGGVLWFLIAEDILALPLKDLAEYKPGYGLRALTEPTLGYLASRGTGVVIVIAWSVALLAAGTIAFTRRDVA